MAKKEIRLQYSGFVIFATKILSVVSGLVFQLMIARATTLREYDIWFNLSDLQHYFTLLATALPFWSMRFVARNKEGAIKTGIIANMTISAVAAIIYLSLVPLMTSYLGISQEYLLLYFLVSVQIIELYSVHILESCLRAKIPHTIGYGLLILEAGKVIMGYVLIIQLQQAILGALISFIVAFSVQIAYYTKLLRNELKGKIRWEYVKEWMKGSLGNIYNVMGNRMATFIFIILFIYGGEGARGRYGLAKQIANVIHYSSFLAFALYPKLIAERRQEDIMTSIRMVLMFAIPMTVGAIALSESYVIIMKSVYRDTSLILMVLAVDAFAFTISNLFKNILFGVERIDERARVSLRKLAKSRLFAAFSLPYLHSAITLPVAFFVLTNYAKDPLQAAMYVGIINASARFAAFFLLYVLVRRSVTIDLPWKNIAKYVLASLVMAIFLIIIRELLHPTRIYLTLIVTAFGGCTYLILLMAIDREARMLVRSIWEEAKSRVVGIFT